MLNKLVFIISFIGRNHWHNHGFYCRACLVMANAFGCRDGLFHNILLMHLLKQNMIISSTTCKISAKFCILQKITLKKRLKHMKTTQKHRKSEIMNI